MLKHLRINISLLLFSLLMFAYSNLQANDLPKTEVENTYYHWCSAISTAKGDGSKIVKFYAKDAVLHPTLSSKMLVDHQGLTDYFNKLTSYKDIKCTPNKLITHIHGHTAINSGTYTFSYKNDHDLTIKIHARFSFVYRQYDHEWLIVNHHSSMMPHL